jgi:hypothetical protein
MWAQSYNFSAFLSRLCFRYFFSKCYFSRRCLATPFKNTFVLGRHSACPVLINEAAARYFDVFGSLQYEGGIKNSIYILMTFSYLNSVDEIVNAVGKRQRRVR